MEIRFYKKNTYGKELFYLDEPEIENIFFEITGQKTLTKDKIIALQKLGFNFLEVLPAINL